jgi:hypothetical protein
MVVKYYCHCLNCTLHVDTVLDINVLEGIRVPQGWKISVPSPEAPLTLQGSPAPAWVGNLALGGVTAAYPPFLLRRSTTDSLGWMVHTCRLCDMEICATSRLCPHVILHASLTPDTGLQERKDDPHYSRAFNVIIPSGIDPQQMAKAEGSLWEFLNARADASLISEKAEMERRISEFRELQEIEYHAYCGAVLEEKKMLVARMTWISHHHQILTETEEHHNLLRTIREEENANANASRNASGSGKGDESGSSPNVNVMDSDLPFRRSGHGQLSSSYRPPTGAFGSLGVGREGGGRRSFHLSQRESSPFVDVPPSPKLQPSYSDSRHSPLSLDPLGGTGAASDEGMLDQMIADLDDQDPFSPMFDMDGAPPEHSSSHEADGQGRGRGKGRGKGKGRERQVENNDNDNDNNDNNDNNDDDGDDDDLSSDENEPVDMSSTAEAGTALPRGVAGLGGRGGFSLTSSRIHPLQTSGGGRVSQPIAVPPSHKALDEAGEAEGNGNEDGNDDMLGVDGDKRIIPPHTLLEHGYLTQDFRPHSLRDAKYFGRSLR